MGEVCGKTAFGRESLEELRFVDEPAGKLQVWALPDEETRVKDRYITVVDIGGRSVSADYSVIVVFDRYWQMHGGVPEVVAQWRGRRRR